MALAEVLQAVARAWSDGFSTRSDFARTNAEAVAEASCKGLITTLNVVTGAYGRQWLVTPKGCRKLFKQAKEMKVRGFRRYRQTDPETSHDAAERVDFDAAHYRAISAALADLSEATIYDIASLTSLSHVQVARRLPEMHEGGFAEPTGTTATGPTKRQCRLWRALEPL